MYKSVEREYLELDATKKRLKRNEGENDFEDEFKQKENPLEAADLPSKKDKNQKLQGLGGVRSK